MAIHYNSKISTDGLVLCLDAANPKSYPGTGTTWTDLSGNGNNGTLVNGVGYSGDNLGSLVFDGTNDVVSIAHNSNQNPSNLTINSWVSISSAKTSNILGKGANGGYRLRISSNFSVVFFDRGATNILGTSAGLISPNTWYNIVATGSGSGLQIYINGSLTVSNSTTFGGNVSTQNLAIGAEGVNIDFNESFIGSIASVSLYNRVLTASEIQQNFNATRSRFSI
jgi:hypothetical protein